MAKWLRTCMFLGVLISLAVIAAGVTPAGAWWDGKWKHRKKIVLDTTAQGADIKEALTDATVLVRLHSGNFDFSKTKDDGADIRFVASDDKTALKYHIERYDPKEEMVLLWVKVPRLAPASKEEFLWIYYGNSGASAGQEPGGTFDTGQIAVYHLGEKEGTPRDSTAYGNHGKELSGRLGTPAPIGRGVTFRGEGDRLVIPKSPSLSLAKGFTFSAWVRLAGSQSDGRLFSWDDGKQSFIVAVDGTRLYSVLGDQKKRIATEKSADLPPQKWIHVAVTAEGGKNLSVFIDGRERATGKLPAMPSDPASDVAIGASLQGKNSFSGDMDEVRISGTARSSAWLRAEALGQGPETPLLTYLEEETSSGGIESTTIHLLVVTAKAITLDGWLVIGIIVVMVGITWALFVIKFLGLRKTKRDNGAFFSSFTESEDMHGLKEREDDFANSSLYRAYRAGLGELERRLARIDEKDGRKTLPLHGMTAFNAALEKAALQESKRSVGGLLLFTLSISGGPFLGLFGTVWGVINTFAGVAEAGEANLTAIAPGVASALACTLMGLVLAIPALFQYTYLSAEIKNNAADMNVFTREFSTWVEEEYGRKHE